jgi:hypothetical protein
MESGNFDCDFDGVGWGEDQKFNQFSIMGKSTQIWWSIETVRLTHIDLSITRHYVRKSPVD